MIVTGRDALVQPAVSVEVKFRVLPTAGSL